MTEAVIPTHAWIQSLYPRKEEEKKKPWILYLTGSPIKNVGDKRRG